MTKFLSKIFLSGILLSSVSGYCSSPVGLNINACIDTIDGTNKNVAALNSDYTTSIGINVGTTVFNTNDDLPPCYQMKHNDKIEYYDQENGCYYIAAKKINRVWESCKNKKMSFTFNKAELNLNGHTLTINKDKNFTVANLGQVTGAGTIKLTENNTILFETGSSVGKNKKEVTLLSNSNSNKIDLTNYLSLDNRNVIFNSDGQKLFLNLKGGQNIHLFDKISNKFPKQNIINSFNNSSTVLFPNIKAEINPDGNNESYNTLVNVPYLVEVINSTTKNITAYNKINNNKVGNDHTIKFKSILLDKIFDSNKINGNVKLKFGDDNISISNILKDLIQNNNEKQLTINVDSFMEYDSSIDIFSFIQTQKDFHLTLSVENYKINNALTDFNHIQAQNITISDNIKNAKIRNAHNVNYNLGKLSPNTELENCSNVIFVSSNSKINGINLINSNAIIKGNVKIIGSLSGDENSSLTVNGHVTFGEEPSVIYNQLIKINNIMRKWM